MIDNNSAMPAPFSNEDFASFYGSNVLGNHYIAAMVNYLGRRDSSGLAGHHGLARSGDQFQSKDITFWGVFALAAWAVALVGSNLSGLIPPGVLGGLHASRLDGASLNQLRSQVEQLQTQAAELRQENTVLLQRFMLNEQQGGEVTRRVGALEQTMPKVIESLNGGGSIDRTAVTASTRTGAVTTFSTDGGSVSYTKTPLSGAPVPRTDKEQPMPRTLTDTPTPDASSFGVALGPPIDANEGEGAWESMNSRVGTLLVGLAPILGHVEGGSGRRLVVGPIASEADARELCGRMAKIGIACASVPFIGDTLPLLN